MPLPKPSEPVFSVWTVKGRPERYGFIATTGKVADFGKAVDAEVRTAWDHGYGRTLHLSHSVAFEGGQPFWSAVIVFGVEDDELPPTG